MRHSLLLVAASSIACMALFTMGASATGPGGWSHVGNSALNGAVYALNADAPGFLYVGGNFTTAGGQPAAHIASWNGVAWRAVGSPATALNGDVHAIAYHAGKVYVGGVFTNAGGNPNADFLAVWDGVSWKPFCNAVGPAFGGSVAALQVIGSTLYVGGAFQNGAGINAADYLLACDLNTGAVSSTVLKDGDISGAVYALTADSNGTLYAAGQFINMERIPAADHVASYNGSWHAMGSGTSAGGGAVDDYVRSITARGTDVYIGSDSVNIAGIANADHVARWDGSAWSAMGSATGGTNGWFPASTFVYAMTTVGPRVFVAGSFQNANGDPRADHIAAFDGSAWHNVGSDGAGNGPWLGNGLALATFRGLLYAGGNFTRAGGDNLAGSIASYPLVVTPPKIIAYTLSPSAFDPPKTTTVKYTLSVAARVTFTVQKGARKVGALTRAGRAGANQFRFNGKVGGKALKTGLYSLVAVAVDAAGNRSTRVARRFRISG